MGTLSVEALEVEATNVQTLITRLLYRLAVSLIDLYARVFWSFRVSGADTIPAGAKIFVSNHVTSTDPYWVMLATREFLHMVIGPLQKSRVMSWLFRVFEQVNAMPEHRKTVVDQACHYLARGESIYILPEGDLQPPFQLGHFYAGVARMYRQSGAPIVPMALAAEPAHMRRHPRLDVRVEGRVYKAVFVWRGRVGVAIGAPFTPKLRDDLPREEDDRRITQEVRSRINELLQTLRRDLA